MPLIPNLHRFFKYTCNDKYSWKDIDRVISKIDTTPGLGPEGDCWEWRGTINDSGYGTISISISKGNKHIEMKIHRVVQEIATNKLIPDGKCVLHKCDNRRCVKSYIHLQIGTNQDNVDDRENKRRGNQVSGENHYKSKLTWVQVIEIRRLYATSKHTIAQLAFKFNVNRNTILPIIKNKTWRVTDSTGG